MQPLKDPDNEHPIPTLWRDTIRAIVNALAEKDYQLTKNRVFGVRPITVDDAEDMRRQIEEYGETLVALNDETWSTSVAQWQDPYWEALVDLWTAGEGRSDLVLSLRVWENDVGFEYHIQWLHVP